MSTPLNCQIVDFAVVSGHRIPGLDADIGCLGLRRVPNAEILHVGVGNGDRAVALGRAEGDGLADILEEEGIVVEEVIP